MSNTNNNEVTVGIDLGTTNSCVAVMGADGKPMVLENAEGLRTTPSVVSIDEAKKSTIVGQAAKNQAVANPTKTIYAVKRLIGHSMSDVAKYTNMMPYKVASDSKGRASVEIDNRTYTPEEISAKILQKLVSDASAKLGRKITSAVITVPAYFNDDQRQATKVAAEIAGLKVERLVNEPTAAALAYGMDKQRAGNVAVFDLGGGTFDVSILHISDGVVEVKSTNGDTLLGGEDFDNVIIKHVSDEFKSSTGVDLLADKLATQRLKEECEKAKKSLSSMSQVDISLPFITANASGPLHLNTTITRSKFEDLVKDLIERTKIPCQKALDAAKLQVSDINEVILVGGMTRMPKIVEFVTKFFGKEPHQGVNPDEVVALGAAVQAGVLSGDVGNILLLDVTPLSLGIETEGGVFTAMIPANSAIPTRKSQVYSTAANNQSSVTIRIFQGERAMAADNKLLGNFDLMGIDPAPRGVPQIEVTFDIDANGIVKVSAKDKKTGREQQISIQNSASMTKEEIEQAKADAQMHAEEDAKKRQFAEKSNQVESVILATENALTEHGSKISDDEKAKIESALFSLKQAIANKNTDDMDKHMIELNSAAANLIKLAQDAQGSQDTQDSQAAANDTEQQPTEVESKEQE